MKCFIYRNINRRIYSIRALEGEHKGLIVGYAPVIEVKDASFYVSEAGRQRVLEQQTKNVHAGIVGEIVGCRWYEPRKDGVQFDQIELHDVGGTKVTYNPYLYDSFVEVETKNPVAKADRVYIEDRNVCAYGLGI